MIVAFKQATGGRNMRALMERIDTTWDSRIREIVGMLMDEGMSGTAYVTYACGEVLKLRGRLPFASEIFSVRSACGWIRGYRKEAASLVSPVYEASQDRLRMYAARARG